MNSKTKTILVTAFFVAVIAAFFLRLQFQTNARQQDELDAAQKQAAALKAQQHKTETKLDNQSVDLQILRAEERAQSTAAGGEPTHPKVNPRLPMPGVYPNRPKLSDLRAAMAAGQMQQGEPMIRSMYGNFFQKMQLTPAQIDAFVKIQLDELQQKNAIYAQMSIARGSQTSEQTTAQKQAAVVQAMQPLQPQLQALEQNATTQLQPLLGSADNVSYYQDYAAAFDQRLAVLNDYEPALEGAGLPPLTLDQEEQLTNLAYQNLVNAHGDPATAAQQFPQVLQQVSAFLTPEQVQVLQRQQIVLHLTINSSRN